MSKYLDEAGVKELLKLVKGYIDLKISGDSVYPNGYDIYNGAQRVLYMLTINDTYSSGASALGYDVFKKYLDDSGLQGSDIFYLYINGDGSLIYEMVGGGTVNGNSMPTYDYGMDEIANTDKATAIGDRWKKVKSLMPNLETVYIKSTSASNVVNDSTEQTQVVKNAITDSINYYLTPRSSTSLKLLLGASTGQTVKVVWL